MKKLIIFYIFFILIVTPIVLADSSVTMETMINESLFVTFSFANIEPQLYNETKIQGFSILNISNAIKEEFKQQDLTNVELISDIDQNIFNNDTYSIHATFYMYGSDIVSYTLNKTDMTRTFRVRTDWRKFQVSLTQNFSLNFEEYFGTPLTEWQQVNHTFEKSVESPFEMSFRFILPEKASAIHAEDDTIIFKVPLAFEDTLLNSPFLILGAIIVANIIFVAYRKARK